MGEVVVVVFSSGGRKVVEGWWCWWCVVIMYGEGDALWRRGGVNGNDTMVKWVL